MQRLSQDDMSEWTRLRALAAEHFDAGDLRRALSTLAEADALVGGVEMQHDEAAS